MTLNLNNLKTFYNAITQKFKSYRGNWEQNDPTADDYIKNRPFYVEETEKVILPHTVVTDSEITLKQPLVEGQIYCITWDGVEYNSVAREYEGYLMLGNNAIYDYDNGIETDTGKPFALETYDSETTVWVYTPASDEGAQHTISITKPDEIIHKLDKKFIDMPDVPDNIATEEDVYDIMSGILGEVAFTNSYESLNNRPTIYTDYNDLNNIPCNSIVNKRLIDYTESSTDYDGGGATNTTKFSFGRPFSDDDTLQAGKKYEVVIFAAPQYGGVTLYTKQFIAEDVSGTGLPRIILGNMFLFDSANENTGDPVFINWYNNDVVYGYVDSDADVFERLPFRIEIYEITETVNQLDEKFIPETIARTDHEHSWNDLKDRPFYEEIIASYDEQVVTTVDVEGLCFGHFNFNESVPEDGNVAVVTFNGDIYRCKITKYYGDIIIGNASFDYIGEDTGEPFMLFGSGDLVTSSPMTATISVQILRLEQMDSKFLRDDVAKYGRTGELTRIEWDGNTDNVDSFVDNACAFYKVSDLNVPFSHIVSLVAERSDGFSTTEFSERPYGCMVVGYTAAIVTDAENNNIPSNGVYFRKADSGEICTKIEIDTRRENSILYLTNPSGTEYAITIGDDGTLMVTNTTVR